MLLNKKKTSIIDLINKSRLKHEKNLFIMKHR